MKTIQEVIRSMDPKEIEYRYFAMDTIDITELKGCGEMTINEYRSIESARFQNFLKKLCGMEAKHDPENEYILLVHKVYGDAVKREVDCVSRREVETLPTNQIRFYAYEFTETKEALSFFVADNPLTQRYIMEVVVSFLYEMLFFGYDRDGHDEEEELIKEADSVSPEDCEEFKTDDFEECIELPKEPCYPSEEIKKRFIENIISDYYTYCKDVELTLLKELLQSEK